MFKSENFKVIRTFLILTVLAGGLFIAFSANKTSAGMIPCCSDCEAFLDACRADCFAQYPTLPEKRQVCIQQDCLPFYTSCAAICTMSC